MNKWLLTLTFISLILTIILFLVSRITSSHNFFFECDSDDDCIGETSTCENNICHCDVYTFHPIARCDINSKSPLNILNIITLIVLIITIILSMIICIKYDKEVE